jgi:hypothetical protein
MVDLRAADDPGQSVNQQRLFGDPAPGASVLLVTGCSLRCVPLDKRYPPFWTGGLRAAVIISRMPNGPFCVQSATRGWR